MIDNAEKYLRRKIKKLVITVPCYFNNSQRLSIKKAAELIGLNVIRIINEPTAAVIAYHYQNIYSFSKVDEQYKEKKILVFDFGGKNINITIIKNIDKNEENFVILSNKSEQFVGGEDFDYRLVDYFLDKFCVEYKESKENIIKDKKAIKRLKIACENIKKSLSENDMTQLLILNFYKQKDIFNYIKRAEFEDLCRDLFEKIRDLINDTLKDAKLTREEINEIVLVGGSSKIPKIKSLLMNYFFSEIIINDLIDPDIVLTYGATLFSKNILYNNSKLNYFYLFDTVPLSLGINIKNKSKNPEERKEGDLMKVIIKRGTKIPCFNEIIYEVYEDNQKELKINIFEGEKKYVKYNHLLGSILIKDLPEKNKGKIKIHLKFFIDINGILLITANENNNSVQFTIKNYMNFLESDIIKIKEKYERLFPKDINNYIDYKNLRESLIKLKNVYEDKDDEDDEDDKDEKDEKNLSY